MPAATADAVPDIQVVRPIAFPVLGSVNYGNDWGNCRDGCARRHQGTDMIGVRMQPLLAAVDGTVTRIRYENVGTAGTVISITGADGWYYNYFHVNNDTPGTDDGLAGHEWQISPQLTVGSTVKAGQVIGYMGDSGNAEGSVPHLHFEIRTPDRTPVNPYPSLTAAQAPETCMPVEDVTLTDPTELTPAAVSIIPIDGRGRWLIDPDGRLFAEGPAAHSGPPAGESLRRNAGAGRDPGSRRDAGAGGRSGTRAGRPGRPRRLRRWRCRRRHGRWSVASRCGASPRRRTTSRTPPPPSRWSTWCSTTTVTWSAIPT